MWTGLTSPSRPWFSLETALASEEMDAEGKAWIEDTEQRIYTVLAQSNFYNSMAQFFQDVATFGTAPMIIYEDAEDVIRCVLPCAGEYYLGVGPRNNNNALYREFTFTVAQIVGMFGIENCPDDIRSLWNLGGGSWSTERVVAHAIEINAPLSSWGKAKGEVHVVPPAFSFRVHYRSMDDSFE